MDEEKLKEYPEKFQKYIKKLDGTRYYIDSGNSKIYMQAGENDVEICNFLPVIEEQIEYDNGKDIELEFVVSGILLDTKEELPKITLKKQQLESFNFVLNQSWKMKAIISAGGNKDRLREISQIVSKDFVKQTSVYTYTGFITKNNQLVYLYHNGYIGNAENVKVDLSSDKLQQYSFCENEYDLKEALTTSYSILSVASKEITMPLLATTYLAPLTTPLRDVNILADFILWIEGKTGTRKSSLAAIALSHYGDFARNTFPVSFRDTLNSIEKKSFIIKDSLFCVDDYCPETIGSSKTSVAERLLATYGDRTGRDRMNQDGRTLRSPYVARGQCIVTGESFPDISESRLARCFLINMYNSKLDLSKLSVIQEKREQLAFAMKCYISWVITNIDNIKQKAKTIHDELSKQVDNEKVHGRLNENIIALYIGFSNFLEFMTENNVVTKQNAKALLDESYKTFTSIATQQMLDVEGSNPVNMFMNALEQLYVTEKIYLKDHQKKDNNIYKGTHIGYINQERKEYWFFPDVLYQEVSKFYSSQGIKFPISKASLWKYLDDSGFLFKSSKNDRRTSRRIVPANNDNCIAFIIIQKEKLGDNIRIELPKNQRGYYVQF